MKSFSNHGWGPTVVIKHEYEPTYTTDGTYLPATPAEDNPTVVYTQYGHLDSVVHLAEGQQVEKGEYLGQIGQICGWIPHLHFEIKDQAAIDYDRTHSSGAGFGYSGTDGHAPNRYIPQAFIEANQHIELPQTEVETEPKSNSQPQSQPQDRTSIFTRIKHFFANIFSRTPGDPVEGEVADTPADEQRDEPQGAEPTDEEETQTPIYDADILSTDTITIAPSDREALITIRARNSGNQEWRQSEVSLNVVGGRAANAPYRHSSWLTDLRPTRLDQARVAPGDIGTFTTLIRVPEGSGDITFRAQLVRQSGGQFLQLGSAFATINIVIAEEGTVSPDVAGEQVSNDGSDVPMSNGITRQIRDTIDRVTRDVGERIGDAVEQLGETTRRIFFGGGGGSSSGTATDDDSDTLPEEAPIDSPNITITLPTTSPYIATTSTIELTGTINDVVSNIGVSTTASGTLSFSTTSLTWQWIGMLGAGTTTFDITAASAASSTSTQFIAYYAPVYELTSPTIIAPTTSSVWYTSASSTDIAGSVDSRASSLVEGVANIPITSSTWEYTVTSSGEGTRAYEFIVSDEFGNSSPTTTFTIVYDTTAPSISTSSYTLTTTSLAYSVTATDTVSGIASYELQMRSAGAGALGACADATSTVSLADVVSTSTCEWGSIVTEQASSTIALPEIVQMQDLVVRVRAVDRAGNVSDWEYQDVLHLSDEADIALPPVLITEIAWMGTVSSTADEWIELMYTGASVDIHHWWIVWGDYDSDAGTYEHEFEITIPGVPADLPFTSPSEFPILFERIDDDTVSTYNTPFIFTGALGNGGEYIALLDSDRNIVDEVDASGGWFAGDNSTKASMMRRSFEGASSNPASWCTYTECSAADPLWDTADDRDAGGNIILGTPGGPIRGGPVQQL